MNRTGLSCTALLLILAPALAQAVPMRIVIQTGDPVPGQEGEQFGDHTDLVGPTIGTGSHFVFRAEQGWFEDLDGTLSWLQLEGSGVELGGLPHTVSVDPENEYVPIATSGDLAFLGTITDDATLDTHQALLRRVSGVIEVGMVFDPAMSVFFPSHHHERNLWVNDYGHVAVQVYDSTSPYPASEIWADVGSGFERVVGTGDVIEELGGFQVSPLRSGVLAITDDGVVLFEAWGQDPGGDDRSGVYFWEDGLIGGGVLVGDSVPDLTGSEITDIDAVVGGLDGSLALTMTVELESGQDLDGVWAAHGFTLAPAFVQPDPDTKIEAPGVPDHYLNQPPVEVSLSATGALGVTASLWETATQVQAGEAVWVGVDDAQQLIARTGDTAPGLGDALVFADFIGAPVPAGPDRWYLMARVSEEVDSVTSWKGMWVWEDGALDVVFSASEPVSFTGGETLTIVDHGEPLGRGDGEGSPSSTNAAGLLAIGGVDQDWEAVWFVVGEEEPADAELEVVVREVLTRRPECQDIEYTIEVENVGEDPIDRLDIGLHSYYGAFDEVRSGGVVLTCPFPAECASEDSCLCSTGELDDLLLVDQSVQITFVQHEESEDDVTASFDVSAHDTLGNAFHAPTLEIVSEYPITCPENKIPPKNCVSCSATSGRAGLAFDLTLAGFLVLITLALRSSRRSRPRPGAATDLAGGPGDG